MRYGSEFVFRQRRIFNNEINKYFNATCFNNKNIFAIIVIFYLKLAIYNGNFFIRLSYNFNFHFLNVISSFQII